MTLLSLFGNSKFQIQNNVITSWCDSGKKPQIPHDKECRMKPVQLTFSVTIANLKTVKRSKISWKWQLRESILHNTKITSNASKHQNYSTMYSIHIMDYYRNFKYSIDLVNYDQVKSCDFTTLLSQIIYNLNNSVISCKYD